MSEKHVVVPNPIGMSYFGISFEAGGIWEGHDVPRTTGNQGPPYRARGTSHLMEHLMCKPYEYLYPKMRELGIEDNAGTSDNKVVFFAYGLSEHLGGIAQTMIDKIINQDKLWSEEEFENEKNIVLQEYDDYFNRQDHGAWLNFMRKYYNYYGAIGRRKEIEEFSFDDSIKSAEAYFKSPNLICEVLHGSKDRVKIPDGMTFKSNPLPGGIKFGEYNTDQESVPKEDQSVVFMFSKNTFSLDIASKVRLISICLAGGLESPLYQETREKRGLVYNISIMNLVMGSVFVPMVDAQTGSEDELIDVLSNFFSKDMSEWISEERFRICKSGIVVNSKMAAMMPHSSVTQTVLGDYNPFEGIDNFSYEEAIVLANQIFCSDNLHLDSY